MSRIHSFVDSNNFRKVAIGATLLCGLALSTSTQAQFYFENFDGVRGLKITDAGFTGRLWKLASVEENKFMVSVPARRPSISSEATSPSFSFSTEQMLKLKGGFTVQYELQYPRSWKRRLRELLKPPTSSLDFLDPRGRRLITLVFRPNPPANADNVNLILIDRHTGDRKFARTKTVTPFGRGSRTGTVDLKIAFRPNVFGGSTVEVFYGQNGELGEAPLIVHEFRGLVEVNRLTFRHRRGRGSNNDRVRVDDISVRSNDLILFFTQPGDVFDHELLTSDGSTREVFDAESYLQGSFRLMQAASGEDQVESWDNFLTMIHFVKNTADSINGVPLLITKAEFTALDAKEKPETKIFFMGAFAEETLSSQDITILSSPAFQLSDDAVESIDLYVDGVIVPVDPAGKTPFQFSSKGEKIVRLTVRFVSGFVGENRFRVIVE